MALRAQYQSCFSHFSCSFLGILAIVQVVFLPGYLTLRYCGIRGDLITTLACSFFLSLIINQQLVTVMVVSGVFARNGLLALVAVEMFCLAWLLVFRDSAEQPGIDNREKSHRPSLHGALIGAAVLIYFAMVIYGQIGTVFQSHDDVFSWNRWALDWTAGKFPFMTMTYPQLLPTNWALIYVLTGDSIQFFAKSIMPLFPLAISYLLIKLSSDSRCFSWYIIPIIGFYLTARLFGPFMASGMADLPVAFFSLASFNLYNLGRITQRDNDKLKFLILGLLACFGAANTKQAGIYMLLLSPMFIFEIYRLTSDGKERLHKFLLFFAITTVFFTVGWYFFKYWQISGGSERDITLYLLEDIHKGRSYAQRLFFSWNLLAAEIGSYTVLSLMMVFSAIGLFNSRIDRGSRAFLRLGVAYVLVWIFFFSYDIRNIALGIPFIAVSAGLGCSMVYDLLRRRMDGAPSIRNGLHEDTLVEEPRLKKSDVMFKRFMPAGSVFLLLTGVIVASQFFPDHQIRQAHTSRLRELGDVGVNFALIEYFDTHSLGGGVLTNYRYFEVLPGLSVSYDNWYLQEFDRNKRPFVNLQALDAYLENKCNKCRYLLLVESKASTPISNDLKTEINARVINGTYRIILQTGTLTLFALPA